MRKLLWANTVGSATARDCSKATRGGWFPSLINTELQAKTHQPKVNHQSIMTKHRHSNLEMII